MRRHSLYERVMVGLVGLVLLIGAGLAARAAFWPAMTYSTEVRIGAADTLIWEMMSDPKQRARWQRGVVDIIPLIEGDLMLGARNLVLFQAAGERHEIEEEVMEYEPSRALYLAHSSDAFASIIHYEITSNRLSDQSGNHSSVVTLQVRHTWHGFGQRLTAPFYYFQEKQYAREMLERLKELSEEQ